MIMPPIMLGVVSSLRGSSRFPAIFRLLGINTEQPSNVWDRQLKSTIVMWPGHIYGYINYVCTVYNYVYIYIYIVSHDQLYPQWYGHRRMVMGMTIPQTAIVRHPTFPHQAGYLLQSIHPYPMKIPWKYVLQWTSMNRIQLTTDLAMAQLTLYRPWKPFRIRNGMPSSMIPWNLRMKSLIWDHLFNNYQ